MRTLLLGATGTIGSAILDDLTAAGHAVVALARSADAERRLAGRAEEVVRGDLREPAAWAQAAGQVDAIVHAAATFSDDMGEVDRRVVEALIAAGMAAARRIRFVYTGGCWLYGETGDAVATEETPFRPLPAFAWMVENSRAILNAACFEGIVIHPAMVYDGIGGVIERFASSARQAGRVEVWGSLEIRWPVVHRRDLATAFRLALERGAAGESYNVAAEPGVRIGDIVDAVARRFRLRTAPVVRDVADVVAEFGDWAAGPALDQQMSGGKIVRSLGWQPTRTNIVAALAEGAESSPDGG